MIAAIVLSYRIAFFSRFYKKPTKNALGIRLKSFIFSARTQRRWTVVFVRSVGAIEYAVTSSGARYARFGIFTLKLSYRTRNVTWKRKKNVQKWNFCPKNVYFYAKKIKLKKMTGLQLYSSLLSAQSKSPSHLHFPWMQTPLSHWNSNWWHGLVDDCLQFISSERSSQSASPSHRHRSGMHRRSKLSHWKCPGEQV